MESKKNRDTWEIYQDKRKEWRWRRTASNGRIVGASTEGYINRIDCILNAERNGYLADSPSKRYSS
ncbi:MAG: DUF1508 domain-containing protein [Vicingus serpentipes]|nr:DUF1508 domain-containing protein [Vicingus serpentipes]